MNNEIENKIRSEIKDFHLPRYHEIPDVGLLLEQTVRLVNGYLETLGDLKLTPSMISNYVKQQIIGRPEKKQYSREQISYLVFIAIVKTVLSLEDIKKVFELQKENYSVERAYNYFCDEFENVLQYIFENKTTLNEVSTSEAPLKELLRNMIITTAYRIHLEKYLREMI